MAGQERARVAGGGDQDLVAGVAVHDHHRRLFRQTREAAADAG